MKRWLLALLAVMIGAGAAWAEDERSEMQSDLVKQANAPLSSVLQVRLQDSFAPQFWDVNGKGNTVALSLTMPLPEYRLLPFPQLSLLTLPVAVTVPGGGSEFGDVRFADVAVLDAGNRLLFGLGVSLIFPTATTPTAGQGKWQAGPAAAIGFATESWLVGVFAQNPISFAGDRQRAGTNALLLQPFATYSLGGGWFIRSQPQMIVDWKTGQQQIPLDLGAGRVFTLGRQNVNVFVEPFWNVTHNGPAPKYGITFGASFLYPNFWR
jgi:hypothetical protein